jgi:hypothetical protein
MAAAVASFLACIYLRCLKPCDPSGPKGCLITLLVCLLSSGWEILVGLKRRSEDGQQKDIKDASRMRGWGVALVAVYLPGKMST